MSHTNTTIKTVSLLSLLEKSDNIRNKIKNLSREQLEASEETLEDNIGPTQNDKCLKIAFWQEYKRAQNEERFMKVRNIHEDIYTLQGWQKRISNLDYVAWLVHPPKSEYLLQLYLIDLGMKRLAEALTLPFLEKTPVKSGLDKAGKPKYVTKEKVNVSLIKEVRGIVEMLQDRAHGSVLHRQANMNIDVSAKDKTISIENIEQIEAKLKKLKEVKQLAVGLNEDEDIIDAEEDDS